MKKRKDTVGDYGQKDYEQQGPVGGSGEEGSEAADSVVAFDEETLMKKL